MSERPRVSVDDLLERLTEAPPASYLAGSFKAKALSKSGKHIHFAIATGIVAVPEDAITSLEPIEGRGPDEFWVDVTDIDTLTHVRHFPDDSVSAPPVSIPLVVDPWDLLSDAGTTTRNRVCNGIDTTCASGGVADMTDDYREYCYTEPD